MIQTILMFVLVAAPPSTESWLGVSLIREGPCLRVVGMALQGPYSRAGGRLNQCIAAIAGHKVIEPEDVSALVSALRDGQFIEVELVRAETLRVRVERKPSDAGEQICLATTEHQVLISIMSDGVSKLRRAVYRAPATLGDIVRSEHLPLSSVTVVLRTCKDQAGKLIEHPAADLRLYFGSTLLVTSASNAQPISPPAKKDKSEPDDEL